MRRKLWTFLALSLMLGLFLPQAEAMASQKTIRVALFIQADTYQLTVPTITFTSDAGMEVVSKGSSIPYLTIKPGEMVRFSANQYRVNALDTKSAMEAQTAAQALNQLKLSADILTYQRKGESYFRVVAGDESDVTKANALLAQIKQIGLGKEVIGPHSLNGGIYSKLEDAKKQVQALRDAGFDASVAYLPSNNTVQYMAMVGNESSQGELATLYQEVSLAFPNLDLKPFEAKNAIILNEDAIFSGSQTLAVSHFYIPTTETVLVRPLPKTSVPSIIVSEKSDRKYRGTMEISYYKGKMALINELLLEEYLYAVVGAEMATGWPMESLKTQAVIARTYALGQGNKYGIAHVTDTTLDQAYYGVARESEDIRKAVNATAGEVLTFNGKLIGAFYYSNAGGMTAEGKEVWGNSVSYLQPVESPDTAPMEAASTWYRIAREDGTIGYVHSDYVTLTQSKNFIGLPYGIVNDTNVNFRNDPSTKNASIDKLNFGEYVTILENVKENNAYSWVEGPFDGVTLMNSINSRASQSSALPITFPVETLQILSKGPSGRVLAISANGMPVTPKSPDSFRGMLGGLRSTKFEVEEMGRYTVLGAGGKMVSYPETKTPLYVVSRGSSQPTNQINQDSKTFVLYGKGANLRVVSKYPMFRFIGNGYGHGLGLSQFGAKALAEQGYDYKQILAHYYSEQVVLSKVE